MWVSEGGRVEGGRVKGEGGSREGGEGREGKRVPEEDGERVVVEV